MQLVYIWKPILDTKLKDILINSNDVQALATGSKKRRRKRETAEPDVISLSDFYSVMELDVNQDEVS